MSDVLLRADRADYERLIARRRRAVIAPILLCASIATAIIVAEYRLMLISFVVITPAIVAVIDLVSVTRQARRLGTCEVRCDGQWLTLNQSTRLQVDTISQVRVQPDAITVVEQRSPTERDGYLLAVDDAPRSPLVMKLEALGRPVTIEKVTVYTLLGFLLGVLANLLLDKVAGVLLLGAIVLTVKGLVDGTGVSWEAGALFGGAMLSLMVIVLLKQFVLARAKAK